MPEIEKCVDDPSVLCSLFEAKRDLLKKKYGRYCLNKPKSEYIISQHNDKYFAVSRNWIFFVPFTKKYFSFRSSV